jgi:hypothetical protein
VRVRTNERTLSSQEGSQIEFEREGDFKVGQHHRLIPKKLMTLVVQHVKS